MVPRMGMKVWLAYNRLVYVVDSYVCII